MLVVETSHVEVNASDGFIRFNPLMKADEHVRYKCTATNDVGSDSEEWQLRVFGGWAAILCPCPSLMHS